jgi:hypothetical protein
MAKLGLWSSNMWAWRKSPEVVEGKMHVPKRWKRSDTMKVAQCRMQLAVEKEEYQSVEKQYQIALGFVILLIALYVIRIWWNLCSPF